MFVEYIQHDKGYISRSLMMKRKQEKVPKYYFTTCYLIAHFIIYTASLTGCITVMSQWLMASQIAGNSTVCTTAKCHQSPRYCPVVRGMHRWPVGPHNKGPVTRTAFPWNDVIDEIIFNCILVVIITYYFVCQCRPVFSDARKEVLHNISPRTSCRTV